MSETPFHWLGRRENDPAHRRVVEFLVMDIQNSPEWVNELCDRLEEVRSGHLSNWERIGNCFRLELSSDGAKIEDLVDETSKSEFISLEEFRTAILGWREKSQE